MRRGALVLALVLCLTGCGGKNAEMERGLSLRTAMLKADTCTFTARVTADYGDKVYSFDMDCVADSSGNVDFTVTAPETIAGISGSLSGQGGKLTFADTALHFPLLAEGLLTPVSAPWVLVKTLRSGCITSAGQEGQALRLSIDDSYGDDGLHLDIWCDGEDWPDRAEISWDGRTILSVDVTNFSIS